MSQVLGLPAGLYLANRWNWHAPFWSIVVLGAVGGLVIAWGLRPVTAHLALRQEHRAITHLLRTVAEPRYITAFAATALLTLGGYLMMPFLSAFTVRNLGIDLESLPIIYLVTGLCTIVAGPLIGRIADKVGRLRVFLVGCGISIIMVLTYTHLPPVPLPVVITVNVVMFVGIFSRLIPLQALISSVPELTKRGSFNAVNSAIQQTAGGVASVIAGHIVSVGADGRLMHFDRVGYVVICSTLVSAVLVWRIQQSLRKRLQPAAAVS